MLEDSTQTGKWHILKRKSKKQSDGWIRVLKMPPPRTMVIVWCSAAENSGLAYWCGDHWMMPEPQSIGYNNITHWRYKPSGPK